MNISIVIPAFNEAASIQDTITRIQVIAKQEQWVYEVIVVNDGSQDATGDLAEKAGAKVIRHPANGGYGLSLQHGIRLASYEHVAITDADGTYPVEELPTLLKMVESDGFDMAVGARQGTEYRRGWWKYPARILFRWLAEYVSGRSIPDVNSGLRVFKKSVILPYLSRTCLGFSFTTSITTIYFLNGLFIGYHPIPYAKRVGVSKVNHFRDTLRTGQILVSVIARYNPIKLFLLLSGVVACVGVLFSLLGWVTGVTVFWGIGVGFIVVSPLVFSFGLLSEGLKD